VGEAPVARKSVAREPVTEEPEARGPVAGVEPGARDRRGRSVGIDLGSRRIGIAVADSAGTVALPRTSVERTGDADADRRRIVELVLAEEAVTVVVGLPLSLDGSAGPAADAAKEEAEALQVILDRHGVEVELFDERLTTVSAHRALAAGAVMLSAWLESGRGR
jgi:putative holliday junction resolvase